MFQGLVTFSKKEGKLYFGSPVLGNTKALLLRVLKGAEWLAEYDVGKALFTPHNLKSLKDEGYKPDGLLLSAIRERRRESSLNPDHKKLAGPELQPKPFQLEALEFIEKHHGRALLADEMGLGKTIEAMLYIKAHPEIKRVVIVCPASLKENWRKELHKWIPGCTVSVLSGRKAEYIPKGKDQQILILNYEILSYWQQALLDLRVRCIILDECHYVKNPKSKRTKASTVLCRYAHYVIGISGTPVVNRPVEFYSILSMILPQLFPSWMRFVNRYCDPRHNGFAMDYSGSSHPEELHEILTKHVMIRRLKKDVLKELPPKVRSIVPLEIPNMAEYLRERSTLYQQLRDKTANINPMTIFERLRQVTLKGKLDLATEWIETFLSSGTKLVVFCHHTAPLDHLQNKYRKNRGLVARVDGGVSLPDRNKAVERFQNDSGCLLFLGNMKAAGTGLTLTSSSNVAFVELPWSPGEFVQAEDRCHRIGQYNSVNVYQIVALNTVEERIAAILQDKAEVLSALLDNTETDITITNDIMAAFEEECRKHGRR